MIRLSVACLFPAASLMLGACVPMMAVSAVDLAARGLRKAPVSNADLKPQAETACSARAAPYGVVRIIDVEQNSIDRIIVWGTAGEGANRQSFECHFGTAITAFKLRPITTSG